MQFTRYSVESAACHTYRGNGEGIQNKKERTCEECKKYTNSSNIALHSWKNDILFNNSFTFSETGEVLYKSPLEQTP